MAFEFIQERTSNPPQNQYKEYLDDPTSRHRANSPSPSISPTPAIASCPDLSRCVSTASTISDYSLRSSSGGFESQNSATSRQSSDSYTWRRSQADTDKPRRRGYVRPQGTNFAASAQSRESVTSLGSIVHLQYYFARTGLLDGKGGRLARKRDALGELDLSMVNSSLLPPNFGRRATSTSSTRSSPELPLVNCEDVVGGLIYSAEHEDECEDDDDDEHQDMLPPTVSTYNPPIKHVSRPPTLSELRLDLTSALDEASTALSEAKAAATRGYSSSLDPASESRLETPEASLQNQGWYELQGMHILDVVTLAIRAAKIYYTSHDQIHRLSLIKSERKIRAELLGVMEVLQKMATRSFQNGMRSEERETMVQWIAGVWAMLHKEEGMESAEKEERRAWIWLDDRHWESAPSLCKEREYAFMKSMTDHANPLPALSTSDYSTSPPTLSPFLLDLRTGLRLVQLHNSILKRSKRQFGAIPSFHTDTLKPYRCIDNLRYWIKAAELRWEVELNVDVMAVVNATDTATMQAFEENVWKWCRAVREEISMDLS